MFEIKYYRNIDGYSELEEDILNLAKKGVTNKNDRIQVNQIFYVIDLLKYNGNNLPSSISKHITKDIYELRPGHNRVLYFYFCNKTFVLLHMFRKKTNKTPRNETQKAIKEAEDYKKRNGEY